MYLRIRNQLHLLILINHRSHKLSIRAISSFFKNYLFILFCLLIFGCVGCSLLHAGFLQLRRAGSTLRCGAQASHCGGFSCCRTWALGHASSRAQAQQLVAHGLSRSAACGIFPAGLKPVSPELPGGFLTTAPPGKPRRGYSSLRCVGFSLWWLLLLRLQSTGSSSCGTWAQQLWLAGSRVQAQQLWRMGLVALQHVGSSQTRAQTRVPCIGKRILNHCATREGEPLALKRQFN